MIVAVVRNQTRCPHLPLMREWNLLGKQLPSCRMLKLIILRTSGRFYEIKNAR